MALYKTPIEAILAAIKLVDSVDLVQTEYLYGAPTAVTPDAPGTNTSITVTAKSLESTFDGTVTVRYTRLQLADLLTLIPGNLKMPIPKTTLDVATFLNAAYGTNFTNDDLVSTAVSLTDGVGDITLVAKDTSMGWLGQVTFSVAPGRLSIADYVKVTTLPGLNYPDAYANKPFGFAYSYWRDFSAKQAVLAGESSNLAVFQDALSTVTGDAWVITGSNRYSLEDAVLEANTDTPHVPDANPAYTHVVVLRLSDKCLGFSGRLFLHYNIPSNI